MRRKSCIFAAKFAVNNIRIIRIKTERYVFVGKRGLAAFCMG